MPAGRPTDYSEEKLQLAKDYLNGGWEEEDAVPQIAGLAIAMGVSRDSCYEWSKHEDKKEFADIFTRVQAAQERKLINRGLTGDFNPAVTKMMLTKHGYSDKQETQLTGAGGGPVQTSTTFQFVGVDEDHTD